MTKSGFKVVAGSFAVSALTLALASCSGNGPSSTPATAGNLKGSYVFSVTGSDGTDGDYAVVGSFVADGAGKITSGVADYNLGSGIDPNVQLTGTYTVANGVAAVHLTDSGSVFDTFTTTLVTSGNASISNFDSGGAGTLYSQVTTGFSQLGIYAVTLKGEGQGTITGSGQFVVTAGNATSGGPLSYTDGPTTMTYSSVTGIVLPPQSNGRGQAALVGNNLAYYVISPTQIIMIGLDERVLLTIPATKQ